MKKRTRYLIIVLIVITLIVGFFIVQATIRSKQNQQHSACLRLDNNIGAMKVQLYGCTTDIDCILLQEDQKTYYSQANQPCGGNGGLDYIAVNKTVDLQNLADLVSTYNKYCRGAFDAICPNVIPRAGAPIKNPKPICRKFKNNYLHCDVVENNIIY